MRTLSTRMTRTLIRVSIYFFKSCFSCTLCTSLTSRSETHRFRWWCIATWLWCLEFAELLSCRPIKLLYYSGLHRLHPAGQGRGVGPCWDWTAPSVFPPLGLNDLPGMHPSQPFRSAPRRGHSSGWPAASPAGQRCPLPALSSIRGGLWCYSRWLNL